MPRRLILNSALAALSLVVVLRGALADDEPRPPASAQKGEEWLAKALRALASSRTAEWDATLDVTAAPPDKQGRKYAFHAGAMAYHFRVKGHSRAHWSEKWEGKGRVPEREVWYEGFTIYVRPRDGRGRLKAIDVGEGEGFCIRRSLVEGGILGWWLAHGFDDEFPGGGYVTSLGAEWLRDEKLDGRPAAVVDLKIGFGFGPQRARRDVGTSRIWIDGESLLLLKRETNLKLGTENEPEPLKVRETYSDWKLDRPMADESFHVEGMGPPDALVDAPEDPAACEEQQTRKFLGFDVRPFPAPQGPSGFDELPADASAFAFELAPDKPSGPAPRARYEPRKHVTAKAPDGSEFDAYCGDDDPKEVVRGHGFRSTRENRRHDFGGGEYHPHDLFVGKRIDGRVLPSLFFRDVGSDNESPHHLAVDARGRCYVALADVDIGQDNRFKLLWLVGDPAAGKWEEAWLVDHRNRFTSWAHP
jgi:hypothetical protein